MNVVQLRFRQGRPGGSFRLISQADSEGNPTNGRGSLVGLCSGCYICDGPLKDFDGGLLNVKLEEKNRLYVAHAVGVPSEHSRKTVVRSRFKERGKAGKSKPPPLKRW